MSERAFLAKIFKSKVPEVYNQLAIDFIDTEMKSRKNTAESIPSIDKEDKLLNANDKHAADLFNEEHKYQL